MKLSILFLLRRNKVNVKGLCPVECRITYNGERKPFATGLFADPHHWNSKKQKAIPPSSENNHLNTQISLIRNDINQAFLFLQVQGRTFEVDDIYKQYKGENSQQDYTVLDMFNLHISKQERLIGRTTSKVTIAKFYQTRKHVKNYIAWKYKKADYKLSNLKMSFLTEFEYYLKAEKQFEQNTVHKTIQRFRQVIKLAVGLDYLPKDPFILYKNRKPKKDIVYLTASELASIEKHSFASLRLQQVAHMFLFCCYTGLAYKEMANLSASDLFTGKKGELWIKIFREKTKRSYELPLLGHAYNIIEQYRSDSQLLPTISNQKFNAYLKEIAEIVGISKRLTHHVARKTFATTVLLSNNVPLEIVSEMLGHSDISTTQAHYAKVLKETLASHMNSVERILNNKDSGAP